MARRHVQGDNSCSGSGVSTFFLEEKYSTSASVKKKKKKKKAPKQAAQSKKPKPKVNDASQKVSASHAVRRVTGKAIVLRNPELRMVITQVRLLFMSLKHI